MILKPLVLEHANSSQGSHGHSLLSSLPRDQPKGVRDVLPQPGWRNDACLQTRAVRLPGTSMIVRNSTHANTGEENINS